MEPFQPPRASSPTRQFAVLSFLTVGGSTLVFGLVLAYFVERGILDREWASTAALVQAAARLHLRPADLVPAGGPAAAAVPAEGEDRFEELTRQVRMLPEVQRLGAYDARGERLWTDAERAAPPPASRAALDQALGGETSVRLVPRGTGGPARVELYVPITFPGEGRVAGAVEAIVDPTRVLATVRRARLVLWTIALLSGALLYAALYGIVWRASRALRLQHATLARRAEELAEANTRLREMQQQLVTAERFSAFGEITAAVAHGIANPLSAIRGTAQVALLDAAEGPLRQRLERIIADVDRLGERMRALLRFGRPVEQRRVPSALDQAVRAALDSVRVRAARQSVRVDLELPSDLPKVRLDPARFEEAFLCLVGNAVDAMDRGGTLRVRARRAGDGAEAAVELAVEDTGPGIPPPVLARVFEPFFTTKPDGTGLGLAVAKKLFESGGGGLRLESREGAGTRALVTLPVDEG